MTYIDKFYDYEVDPVSAYRICDTDIDVKVNWDEELSPPRLSTYTESTVTQNMAFITSLQFYNPRANKELAFDLRQFKDTYTFMVGYWVEPVLSENKLFIEVYRMTLKPDQMLVDAKLYSHVLEVKGVMAEDLFRQKGIATAVYKHLVLKLGYTILGSDEQYFGARKLWAKLSNEPEVQVDIIDYKKQEKVSTDASLYQGDLDQDFDEQLWSYDSDKMNLRSVLTAYT